MVQAGKEYRMSENMLHSIFVPVGGRMVPVTEFVTMKLDTGTAMDLHFNMFLEGVQAVINLYTALGGF